MVTMMTAFWMICSFFSLLCGRPVCAMYFLMGATYVVAAVLVWRGRHSAIHWLYGLIAAEHFIAGIAEMVAM